MADNLINQGELAYELEQLDYIAGHDFTGRTAVYRMISPEGVAASVFRAAEARREPSYENGAVYSDNQGELWVYDHERRGWWAFADPNSYDFKTPRRPLTRLAPVVELSAYGEEVLREP